MEVRINYEQPEMLTKGDSVGDCGGTVKELISGGYKADVYPNPTLCRHCPVLNCPNNISSEE